MAAETGLDLSQAGCPGELGLEHDNEAAPVAEVPGAALGTVAFDRALERVPGKPLQQRMKDAIVGWHGIDLRGSADVGKRRKLSRMPCEQYSGMLRS